MALKLSLEEAVGMLNKWKDERAPVFVFGQNVFLPGLRSVHEGDVDWNISLRGVVGHVSVSPGTQSPADNRVVFESTSGNLSLVIDSCAFSYSEPYERPPFVKPNPQFKTLSALFMYFPTNEVFAVYGLQEV